MAIGACINCYHEALGSTAPITADGRMIGLGPAYAERRCHDAVRAAGLKPLQPSDLLDTVAAHLQAGKIVGWFQGRSEFGPRALGHRSILTRPFPAEMKDYLNARVKFREPFRPFAPVIPIERAREFFEMEYESPYMMHACPVQADKRETIAATVHVDGTCRVQTVSEANLPLFHGLLKAFEKRTGVPVILNTSFNVKGQPIVETPEEAVQCFLSTNIDVLVMENMIVEKGEGQAG